MSFEFDREFLNLVLFALDHGFQSIEKEGGPLIPFTITALADGEKRLARFVGETLEDSVAHAQESIRKNRETIVRYAVAWDGYITADDTQWDAIFVEAGDRNSPTALLFCQRYRSTEERGGSFYERVGDPALVEQVESRLSDPTDGIH